MSRAAVAPRSAEWAPDATASRLGTGWEPAALLLVTTMLLCMGIVSVHSASAVMATPTTIAVRISTCGNGLL